MKKAATLFLLLIACFSYAQQNESHDVVEKFCDSAHEAYRIKDYERAEFIAKKALELSEASGYNHGVVMAKFYLTTAKQMADPATFDVPELLQFIEQFRKLGLKREEARACQFMARLYGNFGNVTEEMKYSLLALNLFEDSGNESGVSATHANLSLLYYDQNDFKEAFSHIHKAIEIEKIKGDAYALHGSYNNLAIIFEKTGPVDSAIFYHRVALDLAKKANMPSITGLSLSNLGNNYAKKRQYDLAEKTLLEALEIRESLGKSRDLAYTHNRLANLYLQTNAVAKAKYHARLSLQNALQSTEIKVIRMAYERLMEIAAKEGDPLAELTYLKEVNKLRDSILNEGNARETTRRMLTYNFEKKQLLDSAINAREKFEAELIFNKRIETERNRKIIFMISGAFFLLLAFTIYRRYKFQERELDQKKKVELAYTNLQTAHQKLKETQQQLIQSEKMASLGELTAGIAHEIQNPLNFVNNFSEVNKELMVELKDEIKNGNLVEIAAIADDVISNEEKINHHGKRADAIVKGMLEHSKSGSGEKELTNINTLAKEYLNLTFQSFKSKNIDFNGITEADFDESIPKINLIRHDIGRVLLNLINNALYAASEVPKPMVTLSTKKLGDVIQISVTDNGNGIPDSIKEKIFQPFFTTKPTGQGTGLGLSLAYDIVKAHGGEVKVNTTEGEGSEFIIQLNI